jgi:hypothetical protein
MQVIDASGNMFGYDSITVAGSDGKPKTLSSAIKLVSLVRNQTGATLTKGTIVYINGGSGNKPTVTKALATSDATSAQTYGVVQSNIANNKNGYVVAAGALDGLNTSAYAPGTQLYLSSTTAGEWTSTKQLAPAHLVYVGIVVRQHVNQGVVEVKIQNGYELDEIHDVQISSPTNGQTLVYDSSTSLWKNGSGGGGGGLQGVHVLYGNLPPSWGFNAATNGIASTTITPSASTLSVYPFSPNKTLNNCALVINVATATAGVSGRVLIYSDLNGFADAKLYESSDLDLSTTGDKTALANFTFNAGTTYWLGYYANGTATMRAINPTSLVTIGLTFAVSSPTVAWVRIGTALGTAPDPFVRNTQQSTAQVNIFIRPS